MRCPECNYELTESEKLLCMIPDGHYCPQCWAKIPGKSPDPVGDLNIKDQPKKVVPTDRVSSDNPPATKHQARQPMTNKSKVRHGHVDIETELCKGCEFCVDVCPEECLAMADLINSRGYRFAQYEGDRCTGCGICYYNCPEPGAIAVTKNVPEKVEVPSGDTTG